MMNKKIIYTAIALLAIEMCSSQVSKGNLTENDYKKWSNLSDEKISPDGNWISYKLKYDTGQDTLFVKNIHTGKAISFPNGNDQLFSNCSTWMLHSNATKELAVYNLKTGQTKWHKNFLSYESSGLGKYLAIHKNSEEKKILEIYTAENDKPEIIPDIQSFKWSPDSKLATITDYEVKLYLFTNKIEEIVVLKSSSLAKFTKLLWSKDGNTLVFLEEITNKNSASGSHKIYSYDCKSRKLQVLHPQTNDMLHETSIVAYSSHPLIVSDNGNKIFFYVSSDSITIEKQKLVQIWDASTPFEYPAQQDYEMHQNAPKLAVWDKKTDTISVLATRDQPTVMLTPDRNHAISYSSTTYEPQYELNAPVDYYITSLKTKEQHLLISNQTTEPFTMNASLGGNFINYFRDEHWWVYDIMKNRHTNVTKNIATAFNNTDTDDAGLSHGYRGPGWSSDDKFLIVYDKFDIWLISANGETKKKITNGRENNIRFRICEYLYSESLGRSITDFPTRSFDLSRGLILEARGKDNKSGYYKWTADGKLHKIVYGDCKVSRLQKSKKNNTYMFVEETFQIPPRLKIAHDKIKEPKLMLQSNRHYKNYNWGKAEIIQYMNNKGEKLQGVLYYPANFIRGKQYPMVVKIYEKLSNRIHEYSNPSLYNRIGFSHANYILDNYFVFMPDIRYELGNPAVSATDCVISGVAAVVEKGSIDPKRIGLIGHSFGGYETSFIITQTSIFAVAVAGAALTDPFMGYLTLNFDYGRSLGWKFESQQFRMGFSPFTNLDAYIKNSPVMQAAKIDTPLLSWTGNEDKSVYWEQSIALHLALRKLQKRNVLLVYPGEGHSLSNPEAQSDLSKRTKNWFDHYLKGIPLTF